MPRLTLSRKLLEKIVITTPSGETVVVQVTKIDTGKVRLQIEAEREVSIMREELLDRQTTKRIA